MKAKKTRNWPFSLIFWVEVPEVSGDETFLGWSGGSKIQKSRKKIKEYYSVGTIFYFENYLTVSFSQNKSAYFLPSIGVLLIESLSSFWRQDYLMERMISNLKLSRDQKKETDWKFSSKDAQKSNFLKLKADLNVVRVLNLNKFFLVSAEEHLWPPSKSLQRPLRGFRMVFEYQEKSRFSWAH